MIHNRYIYETNVVGPRSKQHESILWVTLLAHFFVNVFSKFRGFFETHRYSSNSLLENQKLLSISEVERLNAGMQLNGEKVIIKSLFESRERPFDVWFYWQNLRLKKKEENVAK